MSRFCYDTTFIKPNLPDNLNDYHKFIILFTVFVSSQVHAARNLAEPECMDQSACPQSLINPFVNRLSGITVLYLLFFVLTFEMVTLA